MTERYARIEEQRNLNNEYTRDGHLREMEDPVPRWYKFFVQPCLAEFFGTTFFVFVGCMSPVNGGTAVGIALAHGFTILLLVSSLGPISGGHFNPAVTFGAALSGALSPILAVAYVFCQLFGGLLGAGLVKGVLPAEQYNAISGGAQNIMNGMSPGQAILCEMLLTSILVLVVLMTAVDTDLNKLAPIAIGLSVTVGILAGGSISGASMNPARSFGPAVAISTHTTEYWTYHYVYWVGPLLGSLLSVLIYRFIIS